MNETIPQAELLERERRWSRKAGAASLLGVALFVASIFVQQSAGARADDTADLLVDYHDHGSTLIASNLIASAGLILFAVPLWFLFQAAAGRTELVRRAFLAFAFIGPVLLGVQGIVSSVALNDVADKFVAQAPAVEREARAETRAEARGEPREQGATTTEADGTETETEATSTETEEESTEDQVNEARDELADDLVEDSSLQGFVIPLLISGAMGMVVGMVYIPLWSMRTGLLTRFWATLGMAIGVSLILLGPLGQLLLVIWFGAIGLLLAGIWPGPRPPAWEAGVAIPWPKPGEPEQAADESIEGSGREVSERPLPEQTPQDPSAPSPGETQGQRRKKRKRRT